MRISFLLITEQYVSLFLSLMSEMKPTYSFNIHSKNEVTIFEIHFFMSCFTQKWLNIDFWLMRLMLLVSSIYVFMLYLQMNLFFWKKNRDKRNLKS